MVLVLLVHAVDHGDLVNDVVDADEEVGFFAHSQVEALDDGAQGDFEGLVAFSYFTGLLFGEEGLVSGCQGWLGLVDGVKYAFRGLIQESTQAWCLPRRTPR